MCGVASETQQQQMALGSGAPCARPQRQAALLGLITSCSENSPGEGQGNLAC